MRRLIIRADGAARGNPGPAAAGAVLIDADSPDRYDPDATPVGVVSRPLGVRTNNVAEYAAVVLALRLAERLGARDVELILDSNLIVEQLSGRWRVKNPGLQGLYREARERLESLERAVVRHEGRASNRAADALANLALDDPAAARAMEAALLGSETAAGG